MNRRFAWVWGLATAAIATVVGLIAYHAGQTSQVVTTTTGDGRFFYPGYGGFGFFPFFGLFWILLLGFLIFRFAFWRPWRGPWGPGGGYWHQHPTDQPGGNPPAGGQTPQQTSA